MGKLVTRAKKKRSVDSEIAYAVSMNGNLAVAPLSSDARLLWERDKSAFYLGESLSWMESLPAESVDCIWTDPPYKLSNGGITCIAGKMVSVNKGKWDQSEGVEKDHEFNLRWLKACHRLLKPAGTIWVSGTTHVYLSVGMAMMQLNFRILNDIVWEKPAPPPNLGCRCFTHSTEILLWATKATKGGKDRYTFNYDDMRAENDGKQMKNVWRMHTPSMEEKVFGKHPTQKPVSLVARCLRASTRPGDMVLDPFAGSATTGVAAISEGRSFLGCEGDSQHADLAAERLGAARPKRSNGIQASRPEAAKERSLLFEI